MSDAPLDWKDIKISAARFVLKFKKVTKEASYKQVFWTDFLEMFGVDAIQVGMFEYYVRKLGSKQGEIDYFWPGKVIIEHKSAGKDLDNAMDQAMDYLMGIEKKEELPRYIIVSDFRRIRLMDLVDHRDQTIGLEELPENIEMFGFLAGYSDKRIEGQHPVNVKAAEVMGELYDLLKESNYPSDELDLLLVRIVFCMFAEDADIFDKNIFSSYLTFHTSEDGTGMGAALNEIFAVLDTPIDRRQSAMSSELQNFPYVDGGLFAKTITTPMFDRDMRDRFFKASRLDWRFISPAIFGSLFQSIMDPKTRRNLGAHYTSEENILKLINPLFMDGLRAEFGKVKKNKRELRRFWDRIADIRIMDPACGCGNFLIISYRELRRLEMDILDALYEGQMIFDESHLFIDHFYGIEIGEFASMVANLSMILMDHLMNIEMRNRFGQCREIIPLKEKANIVCADSLEYDWNELVPREQLTFIVGNPPFLGYGMQSETQKKQMLSLFADDEGRPVKTAGKIDFVAAWHRKAAEYIVGTGIRVAFVSTNSITQGEQVAYVWGYLFNRFDITIDFAYKTFKWSNEAKGMAAVHCVIIGFSNRNDRVKRIFYEDGVKTAKNISPYLIDGPTVFVSSRKKPICDVPQMITGNRPADGGYLIIEDEDKAEFTALDPRSEKYIRPLIGSKEFINGQKRWCLWLKGVSPSEIRSCPQVMKRIELCREDRLNSPDKGRRALADCPMLFRETFESDEDYVVIPKVSSENRLYIPIGYVDKSVISTDLLFVIPGSSLYHFGVLTSRMHMAWMRAVCGRLKSDYRYSADVVYNNFPWPDVTEGDVEAIKRLAQAVLDIREKYPDQTYADLYDSRVMPTNLSEAHRELDFAVDRLYSAKRFESDDGRVSLLMSLYLKAVK